MAIVALFSEVLPTQAGLGPSLLATLAVAVAFNPVRIWLQRLVERAIYGARRDPAEAVAAVGARLGDVGAAEGAGLHGVIQALAQVMRFPWAAVVVHGVEIASYGDPPAARHATPLRQGGDVPGGLSNAAIASRLGLAPNTVGNHISNIFAKLQVASRAEAIVRARSAGLGG